jgi:hypothetical protein
MRLGLLADVHEAVDNLRRAIDALNAAEVSRFVVLGDIFETGRAIDETVELLAGLDSVGVWGNHDFGLCRDVDDRLRQRYSPQILDYFGGLHPWVEVQGCRFQHIEPFLDSEDLLDLWTYGGEGALDPARSFAACPQRLLFMGHVHRWALFTPDGTVPWSGQAPVRLGRDERYMVVVHAVQQGWCAWYDTDEEVLCPIRVIS